jgi:hypothetical protein
MEGQKYVLASSYWMALRQVELILSPDKHEQDSPVIKAFRAVMLEDHNTKRVTSHQSLKLPLHVLMHLCDPRFSLLYH